MLHVTLLAAGLAVLNSNVEEVCGANVRPDRHSSKGQLRNSRNGESGAVLGFPQVEQPANPKGKKQKLKE